MKLILKADRMIELSELRQFAAFSDYGTVSEAAEILHLSQPALSRNMKRKYAEKIRFSLNTHVFDVHPLY